MKIREKVFLSAALLIADLIGFIILLRFHWSRISASLHENSFAVLSPLFTHLKTSMWFWLLTGFMITGALFVGVRKIREHEKVTLHLLPDTLNYLLFYCLITVTFIIFTF